MDVDLPDPYKTLGVPKDAELSAIKSAYRKLALKCHPDKVADPEQKAAKQKEFYGVQQAYEILGDEYKRREYDAQAKLHRMRDEVFSGAPASKSSPRSSSKGFYEPSYQNVNIRTAEPPKSFKASPSSGGYKSSPAPGPYPFPQYAGSWERDIPTRSKPVFDEDRKARRAQSYEKPSRRDEEAREAREMKEAKEAKEERRRRREEDERRREEIERRERRKMKEMRELEREREREHQERKAREKKERQELREAEERDLRKQQKKREHEAKDRERDRVRRGAQDEKMSRKKEPYIETESEEDPRLSKKKPSANTKKHVSPSRRDKSSRRGDPPEIMVKTENNLMAAADYMAHTRRRGSKGEHTGYSPEASFTSQFPNPSTTWQPEAKKFATRVEVVEEPDEIIDVATPMRHPPRLSKSHTMPIGVMHMSSSPNTSAPRVPSLNRAATGLDSFQSSPRAPAVPPAPDRHHRSERRRRSTVEDDHHVERHTYRYPIYEESTPRVGAAKYVPAEEIYGPSGGRASFNKVKVADWGSEPVTYSPIGHAEVNYARPIFSGR